jgi:type I restriction-modification system DNA methylase subunit
MTAYKRGGIVESDLNDYEIGVLSQFKQGKNAVSVSNKVRKNLDNIIQNHYVVAFKDKTDEGDYRLILTRDGRSFISTMTAKAKMGMEVESMPKKDYSYKFFKGVHALYKNPYLINRAIEELLETKDNQQLDSDEKAFLKYYTGYGGLEKFMEESTINKGLLYEYYTPNKITQKMWGLAYKYGYSGGSVLEPSCGIGEFIQYAPETANVVGFEINPISARIARILYPNASIFTEPFEMNFISRNSSLRGAVTPMYDLVIGNPPYGKFEGKYAGMGERDYTKATNYIEYFITRSLDLLNSGGLLIFIVGAEVASGGVLFLDSKPNNVKAKIAEKAELIDAYRLPNGVFERTDVVSDIIVLKKK